MSISCSRDHIPILLLQNPFANSVCKDLSLVALCDLGVFGDVLKCALIERDVQQKLQFSASAPNSPFSQQMRRQWCLGFPAPLQPYLKLPSSTFRRAWLWPLALIAFCFPEDLLKGRHRTFPNHKNRAERYGNYGGPWRLLAVYVTLYLIKWVRVNKGILEEKFRRTRVEKWQERLGVACVKIS